MSAGKHALLSQCNEIINLFSQVWETKVCFLLMFIIFGANEPPVHSDGSDVLGEVSGRIHV